MGQDATAQLVDRWTNDADFRQQYEADPEQAIRSAGLELSEDDWQAVRSANFELSDGALSERVNKPRVRF